MQKFVCSLLLFVALLWLQTGSAQTSYTDLEHFSIEVANPQTVRGNGKDAIDFREYIRASPPRLRFKSKAESLNCTLNGKSCALDKPVEILFEENGEPRFRVQLALSDKKSGKPVAHYSFRLLAGLIDFTVSGKSKLDENILITPFNALLVLSPAGIPLFARLYPYVLKDFKSHQIGGKTYYSYFEKVTTNPKVNSTGVRHLLDADFNAVKVMTDDSDSHDFNVFALDHFVRHRYLPQDDKTHGCFLEAELAEVKGQKAEVKFSVRELYESGLKSTQRAISELEGRKCFEPFHLNSAQIIDSAEWVIGLGSAALSWNPKKKKINWTFGTENASVQWKAPQERKDFKFTYTHTPLWTPSTNTLTYFSNDGKDGFVEIVALKFNKEKSAVVSAKKYNIEKTKAENSGGLTVSEEGIVTAVFGFPNDLKKVIEISPEDPSPHFTIEFKNKPYLYRVYRQPVNGRLN